MRIRSLVLSLAAAVVIGCQTSNCCEGGQCKSQAVVDSVASENPAVTRLTVHCMQDGKAIACASTSAAKQGQPSDPEDVKAMQTGETVVLEEGDALDVTVPILLKGGKPTAVCGVTLALQGMTRQQAIDKATAIANVVETGLESCGCCMAK